VIDLIVDVPAGAFFVRKGRPLGPLI